MIKFREFLNEALIQFPATGTKKYNQVVFMGGGMASGKGFALSQFLDSSSFKVFDVDALKKSIQALSKVGFYSMASLEDDILKILPKKYHSEYVSLAKAGKKFSDLELSNSSHATILHFTQRHLKLNEKLLNLITSANSGSGNKPNILFDMAGKKGDITRVADFLDNAGYLEKDRHLVWVLTGVDEALENNLSRERVAPEEDVIKYHKLVADNITTMIKNNDWRGVNGDVFIVLNNKKLTKVVDAKKTGSPIKGDLKSDDTFLAGRVAKSKDMLKKGKKMLHIAKSKGFQYIHLKKQGSGLNTKVLSKFWNWVDTNTPK